MLCRYKNALGRPREGVHKYRIPILDIAAADTLLTVLLALVVSKIFKVSFLWSFIATILLGIILHKLFCVETTINKKIFSVHHS